MNVSTEAMNDPGNLEDKKIEFDDNQIEIPGASAIFSLLTEAQRKKSTTFKVQSNLLDKVKSFLPQLQSENEKLQVLAESDPGKVNIENINENDEHVEMNIGVFQGELISDSESEDSDSSDKKEESKISKSKLIEEL
ncbi:NOP protein chaperone 1-like [Artemia franciscana]